jgi:hypothetical protein
MNSVSMMMIKILVKSLVGHIRLLPREARQHHLSGPKIAKKVKSEPLSSMSDTDLMRLVDQTLQVQL